MTVSSARPSTAGRWRSLIATLAATAVAATVALVGSVAPAVAAPATGTVDQESLSQEVSHWYMRGSSSIAQSFTVGRSGELTGIELYLWAMNQGPQINQPIPVTLFAVDSSGQMTGDPLATGTVPATAGTGWNTVTLSRTFLVVAGQRYAFRLDENPNSNAGTPIGSYSGGEVIGRGYSISFRTYVDGDQSAPGISGSYLTTAVVDTPYSSALNVTGSPSPRVVVSSGSTPSGLSVSESGVLSGTPRATGTSTFSVSATNTWGTAVSVTMTVVVRARQAPGAPTGVVAVPSTSSTAVDVSWSAPASVGDDPITSYQVTSAPASTVCVTSTLHCTFPGLARGTGYTFTVNAVSASGAGPGATSGRVTTADLPGVVRQVSVSAIPTESVISWTAPATDGGAPINGYTVQYRLEGDSVWTTRTTTETSIVLSGLTRASDYTVTVAAVNALGAGPATTVPVATPSTIPTTATPVALTPHDSALTVTWTPPVDDGGSTITGYTLRYRSDTDGWTTVGPLAAAGRTYLLTGLTNGTRYEVSLSARNSQGDSDWTEAAFGTPATTPASPTITDWTPRDGGGRVQWTPGDDGGAPITGYLIRYTRVSSGTWTTLPSSEPELELSGLVNGAGYDVQVAAVNDQGTGPWSAVRTVTPAGAPDAPQNLSAESRDRAIRLTLTPPADNGSPVQHYVLEFRAVGTNTWSTVSNVSFPATVVGMENGTPYEFRAAAVNAIGQGPWTELATAAARTTPSAPESLSATPGDRDLSLVWTAPTSDGGSPITGYVTRYRVVGEPDWIAGPTGPGTSATLTGLVNGDSYEVEVAAVNAAGVGAYLRITPTPPRTVPDAPVITTAVPGDRIVLLSWSVPADNGAAITGYRVLQSPDGQHWSDAATVTDPTAEFTDLTNGTPVWFRVFAINEAGSGPISLPIQVTPRTTADAPSWLTTEAADGAVTLSWTPPADTGGASITDYELERTRGADWVPVLTTAQTTATVAGLTNGEPVQFRVRAINEAGGGGWSTTVLLTPITTAQAPVGLAAVPADGSVRLDWRAPAQTGGSAVTGYTVQYRAIDGAWTVAELTGTGLTIGDLPNGVPHEFRVRATNGAGDGVWSAAVTATPFHFDPVLTVGDGAALTSAPLQPGASFQVNATQLPVGARVTVELHSTPRLLATATVGADGTLALTATLPLDVEPGAHQVVIEISGTGAEPISVEVPVVVAARTAAIPAGTLLAVTGSAPARALLFALISLVGGLSLVSLRRRPL